MRLDPRVTAILARRELRETLRRKTIWFHAAAFVLLAGAVSLAGTRSAGYGGLGGFGRTSASLVNALVLFVPLVGLSAGCSSLLVDRERGTLGYLLAQPITRTELFLGKAIGALMAVLLSLGLGFLVVALTLAAAAGGTGAGILLSLLGHTLLWAVVSLALGLAIGSAASTQTSATGASLSVWLTLVFLADAAFLLGTLSLDPSPGTMLGILLANPAHAFRLAAMRSLRGDLADLGPLGAYAEDAWGSAAGAVPLLALAGWAGLAGSVAYFVTLRRSVP